MPLSDDPGYVPSRPPARPRLHCALLAGIALLAAWMPPAGAQIANPVFVDDSPVALEGLRQARQMVAAGNLDEAVHTLQSLLDTESDRLLADESDPDRFGSVRNAVHAALRASPRLLERYRAIEGPVASAMLNGEIGGKSPLEAARAVERSRLLTSAGFEAALRVAQRRLESAQFDSAIFALAQLDGHPDRAPGSPQAAAALALLRQTLRYVDRPRASALAQRWASQVGAASPELADQRAPIAGPPIARGLSPLDLGPPVDLAEIVAQPLRSNDLTPMFAADRDAARARPGGARNQPGQPPSLHVLPVVAGDTIYVNDGVAIYAWDRFTLSERWMWTPAQYNLDDADAALRRSRGGGAVIVQDVSTLAVDGDWVVAATGLSVQGQGARLGDPRVHALDALTGVERWAATLENLHPDLQHAEIRGPVIIDQGTVILTAWKEVRERRLLSAYLVGLDLATGRLQWIRLLGSAGSLPYSQSSLTTERNVARDGVVYRVDRLGVVAAIEAATGRPRWARKFDVEINRVSSGRPWQIVGPAIIGDRLFALTPDRDRVFALDAQTGALIGSRSADQMGSPLYLLSSGDWLVLVGASTVRAIDARQAMDATVAPARLLTSDTGPFIGRAALAGDRILAPTSEGLLAASVDPDHPEAMRVELDRSGNLLALSSQLIVADDWQVHSYLIWQVAQRMLRERMEAEPADPAPAATFAELAFRAGRTDLIIDAVDAAVRAIERAPLEERSQRSRRRLFQSVLAMVEPERSAEEPRLLSAAVRRGLLDRLGRLSASPDERVAHLLALAEFQEAERQPARAIQAYQTILTDPALAIVAHERRRNGMAISARLEASRRLQRVVEAFGPSVYAVYAQEADRALLGLNAASSPEAFEDLAAAYPAAPAAAQALLRAARRRLDEGKAPTALADLQAAYDVARVAVADPFDPLVSEAAGRLVAALIDANHPRTALATLDRISRAVPGLNLTVYGETRPVEGLRQRASALALALDARPRVGALTEAAYSLDGWSMLQPMTRARGARTDVILLENDQRLALWSVDNAGKPQRMWTLPAAGERVVALRLERESLLLARQTSRGWIVERRLIDRGGALAWATRPFEAIFADVALGAAGATVEIAPGQTRRADEILFAVGSAAIVLADRAGRIASFDPASGQLRWRDRPLRVISDLIVGEERIVASGFDTDAAPGAADAHPIALALDVATGAQRSTINPPLGAIQWLRLDHAENVILGMTRGVASIDPRSRVVRWSIQDEEGVSPLDAWVIGGTLVLIGDDGLFRLRSTFDGEGPPAALDVEDGGANRALARSGGVVVRSVGDRLLLATAQGLALYSLRGEVRGRSRGSMDPPYLPAAVADDRAILVSLQPAGFHPDESGRRYTLYSVDLQSAALLERRSVVLDERPMEIVAIDGAVVVATRAGVVVMAAPTAK